MKDPVEARGSVKKEVIYITDSWKTTGGAGACKKREKNSGGGSGPTGIATCGTMHAAIADPHSIRPAGVLGRLPPCGSRHTFAWLAAQPGVARHEPTWSTALPPSSHAVLSPHLIRRGGLPHLDRFQATVGVLFELDRRRRRWRLVDVDQCGSVAVEIERWL